MAKRHYVCADDRLNEDKVAKKTAPDFAALFTNVRSGPHAGPYIQDLTRAWRAVITAYQRFWKKQRRAFEKRDKHEMATAAPRVSGDPCLSGALSEFDLQEVLRNAELRILGGGPDISPALTPLTNPEDDADVRKAKAEVIRLLRASPYGRPFQGRDDGDAIFSLRPLLGTVRWCEQASSDSEKPCCASAGFQAPGVDPIDSSPSSVNLACVEIFDDIPLDILTTPYLTEIDDFSDGELRLLAQVLDCQGYRIDAATLRGTKRIVRRRTVPGEFPTEKNTKQPRVNLRRFRNQQISLINGSRLRPSPLNLVRHCSSSDASDLEREQILYALAGWVRATNCDRFTFANSGEKDSPLEGPRRRKVQGSKASETSDSEAYSLSLLTAVIDGLNAVPPPPLPPPINVATRTEFMDALSTVPSYGSGRTAMWAYLFVTFVSRSTSTELGLRQNRPKDLEKYARYHNAPLSEVSQAEIFATVRQQGLTPAELKLILQKLEDKVCPEVLTLLTKRQKAAYLLKVGGKLRYAEIAEILRVERSTIDTLLSRARQRIKNHAPDLARQDPGDSL